MYCRTFRIFMPSSFSLFSVRHRTQLLGRRMRRKVQITENIPPNTLSVSKMCELLRKRLEISSNMASSSEAVTLDSLCADKYLERNVEKYASVVAHRQAELKELERKELRHSDDSNSSSNAENDHNDFPLAGPYLLKAEPNVTNTPTFGDHPTFSRESAGADRGFYVYGDDFVDEFVVGSTVDIPGGEMENVDDEQVIRYGTEDAVEEIDFQLPGQSTNPKDNIIEDDDDELLDNYGTVDSTIPSSKKRCNACGANFHCRDSSLPGFVPAEIFLRLNDYSEQLCRRCYMLKRHNFLLNVNVCEVDYRSMMEHLKLKQEVLIILIVDMCDLPGSVYSELPKIIGYQKPMIVVGNKVDLLPPDARPGFLHHFRQVLFHTLEQTGLNSSFNILHTSLISARTGYGVEDLITNIFLRFSTRDSLRNDIYLVGCTNAGKSTLFNAFLQSDLCKVRAVDLVERAATTPWPGTTISLLKFPVMNPSPHKLEIRRRRLLANQAWLRKEERMRYSLYQYTGDIKYATLQSAVGNSFKEREAELQPPSFRSVLTDSEETEKPKQTFDPNLYVFAQGKWCYDTPGTVNSDQVLNLFTLDELINVLPRKMILPRTFLLHPDESLLVAGVAQIDVISLPSPPGPTSDKDYTERRPGALLTVFASEQLPIFIRKTSEIAAFRNEHLGSTLLAVPIGGTERIARFPELKGAEMVLESCGSWKGCADVVLSSLGWVCITAQRGEVRLRAHTPEGRGLCLRQPPLLPFCAQLRGSRIGGTPAYRVKQPVLPDPESPRLKLRKRKTRRNKEHVKPMDLF